MAAFDFGTSTDANGDVDAIASLSASVVDTGGAGGRLFGFVLVVFDVVMVVFVSSAARRKGGVGVNAAFSLLLSPSIPPSPLPKLSSQFKLFSNSPDNFPLSSATPLNISSIFADAETTPRTLTRFLFGDDYVNFLSLCDRK